MPNENGNYNPRDVIEALANGIASKQNKLTGLPGQVVGFGDSGAAAAVQGWSNPNLLDNWYFLNPINQRGQTEYAGYSYGIDRWKVGNPASVLVTDSGIQITQKTSDGFTMYQFLESPLPPGTYTFSVLVSELSGTLRLNLRSPTASYATKNTTTPGLVSLTANVNELDRVAFFTREVDSTMVPIAAKLELGSQQTLAYQDADGNWVLNDPPPNKALELEKCQRYQIFGPMTSIPFFGSFSFLPTPVTLRANPTLVGDIRVVDLSGEILDPAPNIWVHSLYQNGILLQSTQPHYTSLVVGTGLDSNL